MAQGVNEKIKAGVDIVSSGADKFMALTGAATKLIRSIDILNVAVDKNIKTTGKKFGVTETAITVIGIDKLLTTALDFIKKASDPKTDFSKITSSYLKASKTNAKAITDSFRDSKFLAQKEKTKPVAKAGAIAKTPQGGDPVANAASLGAEKLDAQNVVARDKQNDQDEVSANKSAEIEKKLWDKRLNYAGTGAGAMANILQNLYVATGSKNKAMFQSMKAFAIAETLIQTYRAAMGAYAAYASIPYVGPALGIAAASAAVVAGISRVNAIKKTKPGAATGTVNAKGKANPPYKGGSTNAYPVPQAQEQALPTQNITVIIHNPLSQQNWAEIAESEIIPAINDAIGNRNIELRVETVD